MLTKHKYFLLWSTLLYWSCSLTTFIKGQQTNPYRVSLANVTLLSSNRAQAILRIINTNPSFQSTPISLILSLTDTSSTQRTLLNITSLPTQVQILEKKVTDLTQDKEYTILLTILQTNSGIPPLQPVNKSIEIITTNVQSVSINDDPSHCRLNFTCHFAYNSSANGCIITYEEMDINNNTTNTTTTNNSTGLTEVFISREDISQSSASISISGNQYLLLLRNEMYTVEGYGVDSNRERIDSIEATGSFELIGNVAVNKCQDTTRSGNIRAILGIAGPLILLVLIIGVLLLIPAGIWCNIIRKRRRKERLRLEEETLRNHCSLCNTNIPHSHDNDYHGGPEKWIRKEGEKKGGEEEERESPKPEYLEVLPDNNDNDSTYSSPSLSPSQSHTKEEEEEEECTYENIGASNSRRLAPKTTPTGLIIHKKIPTQNGGVAPTSPLPPPHMIKQSSLNTDTRLTHNDVHQRRSMPPIASGTSIEEEKEREEEDDNEYVDVSIPSLILKRNKAYNSLEVLPSN